MVTFFWVNIGSFNGMMPNATKPITYTKVDLSSKVFCGIYLWTISQEVLMNSVHSICSEVAQLPTRSPMS